MEGILRRPLARAPEIAGLLFEAQAVAEQIARVGARRGRHTEVGNLARRHLAELVAIEDSLERNCTDLRTESIPLERVRARGQDFVLSLRATDDAQFDRAFLFSVLTIHGELAELLDSQVQAREAGREARELDRLRDRLLSQEQEADDLLAMLD